ncbi:MAG: DUF481 domain-containing protein [Marinobacter sp.]|uniref:DUF481 domain-containing protein n=1 Tax=Marinobacter sp. TaxID=50741 RepID=UPI00299ED700|nr:DUF481 domain-containing protein [Marinobacter sp.]MDX1634680.1 DUF481 domain-containing protein [Marinobacter sp.]
MRMAVSAGLLVAALSPLAAAQDGDNDWEGEGELGVLVTSGNSDETNINARLGLVHEVVSWRNLAEFRTFYSETEDTTTAEEYEAALETNYKFTQNQYWFLRGAYEDDRFSGYDYRSSATTGYGHRVWSSGERSFLDLSVGAGYRYNRLQQPDDDGSRTEDQAIGRLAGQFDYGLSDNALFRQKLSTEVGLSENETITESSTSLQATVVGNLSMKVAYAVTHLSDPPAGSASTDTETSLSLLYGF